MTALITSTLISSYLQEYRVNNEESGYILSRTFTEIYISWSSRYEYTVPKFFYCFGLPSLLCHLAGSALLLLQYKLVHPWRHLGKKREANVLGKLGGTKRGLDVEMSPWKSGDAVSKEEHHAILANPIAITIKGTVNQPNKLRSYAQFCLHMATRGQNRNSQI